MKFKSILSLLLIASYSSFAQNQIKNNTPQLIPTTIKQVIAAMTLEEKASLVVGTNTKISNGPVIGNTEGKVEGAAGYTKDIPRLGIKGIVLADGPAGLRISPTRKNETKTYYATGWPISTLLASSWDTTLIKKVGIAVGNEVKEYGIDMILAPAMNIQRDPLNGRNFEYYSEDPFVTGHMAAAIVKGIQSNGVGTSIKHFAANNQESNRAKVNVIVSERALREIYLRAFEIAVKKAQPWTVMSSYNKINATYTSQSQDLLTTILRNEWGFKGFVMTDWFGGNDRIAQMNAGNDLIEPGTKSDKQKIIDAVNNGMLDIKVLDKNVERILNILVKTPSFKNYRYSNNPDLKAHALIARKAGAESMILLKNQENTLPLKKNSKIALFGVSSYNTYVGGTGSGNVNKAYIVSIAEGIKNAGYTLNEDLKTNYTTHIEKYKITQQIKNQLGAPRMIPELATPLDTIEKIANESDVAIFTIGRNWGEGEDRTVIDNFNLTNTENDLINKITNAFHAKGKKLIVLMDIGGVIETASWKGNPDAILLTWQAGQEMGNALADIICGTVNPSGKLAITFPVNYADMPSAKNFPGTPVETPTEVVYEEGVYVGYRYFNTFGIKTSFPFGYGLSYTSFDYSGLKLSSSSFVGSIKATLTITNIGKVAGKEVVQLYLSAPAKSMDKPSEELKGFAKTSLLKPGASQSITFTLNARDLASFNTEKTAWIAENGNYIVKIGASSEDIKLTESFILSKDIIVEKVNKALVPQVSITELKKQ